MDRIPLQIIEGRLVLTSVVECKSLRLPRQLMEFVIDTGSSDSYLNDKDVRRFQIPVKGRETSGEVDFGGSRFKQILLPRITMYLLREDNEKKDYFTLEVSLYALQTTKTSEKKQQTAQRLPSILGLDFLKKQKLSLYVNLTENIAYLQYEGIVYLSNSKSLKLNLMQ